MKSITYRDATPLKKTSAGHDQLSRGVVGGSTDQEVGIIGDWMEKRVNYYAPLSLSLPYPLFQTLLDS